MFGGRAYGLPRVVQRSSDVLAERVNDTPKADGRVSGDGFVEAQIAATTADVEPSIPTRTGDEQKSFIAYTFGLGIPEFASHDGRGRRLTASDTLA
jgi:hypothetical protein